MLICPDEVVEAEDPRNEELSMPEPDAVPRGVAVPKTPPDKNREARELTHLPTQPWCNVCSSQRGSFDSDLAAAGAVLGLGDARAFPLVASLTDAPQP